MTETQKRIKEYQSMLPGLKERVLAVALLLMVSLTMVTSATFAWLTISRAPEVTGVSTTVTANGNLEIALATGDGKTPPGESQVGDSSAADGQTVTGANLTWGNLINLSDPSYGLDNLVLRPAQLNTAALQTSPLYGAMYDKDGRITQLNSNFAYTSWVAPTEVDPTGHFGVSSDVGVRAISSTKILAVGAAATYQNMVGAAKAKNLSAATQYANIGNSDKYMQSLATMMGLFMTARMNPDDASLSNPTCNIEDIENLRDMYGAFLQAIDAEVSAIADLLNVQLLLKYGLGNYTAYDVEKVLSSTAKSLSDAGLIISDFDQFLKDRNTIASDYQKLSTLASSGTDLKWSDSGINGIVNNLVDVGKCTIGSDNTPISSIGASNATAYLSGTQEARITNGILYRFEERTGGYIEVKNLGISATVKRVGITVPATVKANIQTTASRDYNLFTNDMADTEKQNTGEFQGGEAVANDTYGLAVDLWVRTNASGSYLTLGGNVLTKTDVVDAKGKDANGNEVQLYTVTRTIEDEGTGGSISSDYTLYQIVTWYERDTGGEVDMEQVDAPVATGEKHTLPDGTAVDLYKVTYEGTEYFLYQIIAWYNSDSHSVFQLNEGETPKLKKEEIVTVIGYEGDNRVWSGNDQISVDATTQGGGSCYVYYADTPEDQARSLALLEALNVAFVDEKGKLLCTALMDTARAYAASGRVIVPLVLNTSNSINLGEDYQGNVTYAITALEKNVPTRITAIVYLDGTKLSNDQVLAASDIQGKLNIQFSSSQELAPVSNEDLEAKERKVSASVQNTSFDYDTHTGDMISNVTVHVDGDHPSTVTAFFTRQISSTQGSREGQMTFSQNADGDWVSSYKFTAPGTYVLRSVQLDGAEYDLETVQTVTITGFGVKSLTMSGVGVSGKHASVMSADNAHTVDLTLQFATNDPSKMPTSVQGRFLREDGSASNVDFVYNGRAWVGTATFLTSGEYTLQYLVLNGNHTELAEAMWQTASVKLGMKVAVYTTSPHTFRYEGEEMEENEKKLQMQVKIMDDTGEEMPGLSGVKLVYGMKGSAVKIMDADLKWNGDYYVGELQNGGPGIWVFSNVTVGGNTLTTATTYPTFTIQSPEPPEYYGANTDSYQYRPNNNATMTVQITHSSAATVQAYITKDGETTGKWVDGTLGSDLTTADGKPANNWIFEVPKDTNGRQEGNWTLSELKLWDVFDKDGNLYTAENPLSMTPDAAIHTKVVNSAHVVFLTNESKNFGTDGSGNVTGTFMQSHTFSGLHVNIQDFEGAPISGVRDVQLEFAYVNGTSRTYGGYSSDGLMNNTAGATITVPLTQVKNGDAATSAYSQTSSASILYAGSYATTLRFVIDNTTYVYTGNQDNPTAGTKQLPANAPVFTVSSAKPTVMITGVSPSSGTYRYYSTATPHSLTQLVTLTDLNEKTSDYSASVYTYFSTFSASLDNWFDNSEAATAHLSSVSLSLDGVPDNASTTIAIGHPEGEAYSHTATFSGNKATLTVGGAENGVAASASGCDTWPVLHPAGTQTIKQITITYGGITYTVDLSRTVTINNPLMPPVASFRVNDSTFTQTLSDVVVRGGTVTFDDVAWTATIEEPVGEASWSAYTNDGEVTDADGNPVGRLYGYARWSDSGWRGNHYRSYQYFKWTRFVSTYTGIIRSYTQNKQITGWNINGLIYPAGAAIPASAFNEGINEVIAVVSDVGNPSEPVETTATAYKYLYGYVSETVVNESRSKLSISGKYDDPPTDLVGTQYGTTVGSAKNWSSPALAVPSSANATTDTIGTNMTDVQGNFKDFAPLLP